MLLADSQIRELCQGDDPMISPFTKSVRQVNGVKVVSYGLSSYGYDFRIGDKFKVFHNLRTGIIDPKDFDQNMLQDTEPEPVFSSKRYKGDYTCIGSAITIPPNSFALGVSVEYFRMPSDVLAIGIGKSTLARCGMILNVTPLEPSWEGYLTIELSNTTPCPLRIYANEGIGQLIFHRGDEQCEINYSNKDGKYQAQSNEVTLPR